jgi:hypothetical protein
MFHCSDEQIVLLKGYERLKYLKSTDRYESVIKEQQIIGEPIDRDKVNNAGLRDPEAKRKMADFDEKAGE